MKYFYNLEEEKTISIGPAYSTAEGPWIKGERIQVLLYHKKVGTGSRPHRHPNEQFIYLIEGSLKATVEDQERIVKPGSVIHIPANALHSMVATTDEDVKYLVAKDTTFGIHGIPEDGKKTGGYYEPGFQLEK